MKKIIYSLLLALISFATQAQCFEIESILVDACTPGALNCTNLAIPTCNCEGKNEMVRFKIGATPLAVNTLTVNWPNNNWLGISPVTATTTSIVNALNSTIIGCGWLKEPIAGVLRANNRVLLITSTDFCATGNSFANLNDTMIVIFQNQGNYQGHFVNYNSSPALRTLSMNFTTTPGCTDAVTYDRSLLVNQSGGYGGTSSANDGSTVEFDPAGVATYTNYGCQAPFINLSVNAGAPTQTVCAGNSIALTATVNGVYNSITWSGGAGSFSPTNSLTTSYTPAASESGGITKLYVTIINSCASKTLTTKDSVLLTNLQIASSPTINASNGFSLCPLGTTVLSYSISNANATGTLTSSWSAPAAATNTYAVSAPTSTAPVTYTLNLTNACGVFTKTVQVFQLSSPTLSITSTSNSLCVGGQLTSTLSLSGSSGNYAWSNGASTSTITVSTPGVYTATVTSPSCGSTTQSYTINTIPNPTITLVTNTFTTCANGSVTIVANSSNGNYLWNGYANTTATLTLSPLTSTIGIVTTTNVCTNASATYTINVVTTPTVSIDLTNVSLCTGQSATLTATSTQSNYNWQPGGLTTNTLIINSAGIYTVTSSNSCFTTSATSTVTINSSPTLSISSSSNSLCTSGQTATLSLLGASGGYSWSNGSSNSTLIVNSPGVYTATVITPSCGSATASFTITALTTPTITLLSSASTLCNGSTATLTAASNMLNQIWTGGATNTNTILINASGNYTVGVSNACGTATASIIIGAGATPSLNLTSSSNSICPNQTATLTVTGGSAPYSWSNSTTTGSVVTTNGGSVSVSYSNNCGTGTATVNVNVINLNAGFDANPVIGTMPVVVNFTNTSSGANSYSWNFGNDNTASTQTVSSQTYSVAGIYTLSLIATNGTCSDTYTLIITVLAEDPTIIIPNVFTPNSDGTNDVFKISSTNISDFSCTIFDRWGLQMYAWDDIKVGWDGKTNGKDVPAGTYFYIIDAKGIDNKEIKKQGSISLFR